ncbi:hypothetical protein Sru01_56480 [Sphaerisporangium rufum]|uniref:Uncharacterized protein n=1 Tax=Sphaerisporangium rufum TaxID=1381558 RepID=A0A919V120_9ACTN|nr:hypothetical protein [Sphaerisporangium rufum]GII80666.1 hypothetical protein Sru01_56480 [Sphaerisporangium rufum]
MPESYLDIDWPKLSAFITKYDKLFHDGFITNNIPQNVYWDITGYGKMAAGRALTDLIEVLSFNLKFKVEATDYMARRCRGFIGDCMRRYLTTEQEVIRALGTVEAETREFPVIESIEASEYRRLRAGLEQGRPPAFWNQDDPARFDAAEVRDYVESMDDHCVREFSPCLHDAVEHLKNQSTNSYGAAKELGDIWQGEAAQLARDRFAVIGKQADQLVPHMQKFVDQYEALGATIRQIKAGVPDLDRGFLDWLRGEDTDGRAHEYLAEIQNKFHDHYTRFLALYQDLEKVDVILPADRGETGTYLAWAG